MKRKHGLLKKAAELSILCGLKVNLVFSDIQPSVFHVFANDCAYKIEYDKFLNENFIKEKSVFHEYSIFDYPFEVIGDQETKVIVEPVIQRLDYNEFMGNNKKNLETIRDTNLKKREPFKNTLKGGSSVKSTTQVPIVLTFDSEKLNNNQKYCHSDVKENQIENISDLPSYKHKFLGFYTAPQEQKLIVESLLQVLNNRIRDNLTETDKRVKLDEHSVLFLIGRLFLHKYFGFSFCREREDHITTLLRHHIDFSSMVECMRLLNESAATQEIFDTKMTNFNNIMLGVLTNPASFDITSLASLRGGKCTGTLVSFIIRSLLQQVRLFDCMHSGEKNITADINAFVNLKNHLYVEKLIDSLLNIVVCQKNKIMILQNQGGKFMFKVESESFHRGDQDPRNSKNLEIFGEQQEKYTERDRNIF